MSFNREAFLTWFILNASKNEQQKESDGCGCMLIFMLLPLIVGILEAL